MTANCTDSLRIHIMMGWDTLPWQRCAAVNSDKHHVWRSSASSSSFTSSASLSSVCFHLQEMFSIKACQTLLETNQQTLFLKWFFVWIMCESFLFISGCRAQQSCQVYALIIHWVLEAKQTNKQTNKTKQRRQTFWWFKNKQNKTKKDRNGVFMMPKGLC